MSNREDLVARLLGYEAAARAIKAALKAEGQTEHTDNGTVPTWRLKFATVSGSESHDAVEITDLERFLDYLETRYPTEVETRTVRVVRNPEWLIRVRENLAALHRADLDEIAIQVSQARPDGEEAPAPVIRDHEGTKVPGVAFTAGGSFLTVSVTPKMDARYHVTAAARIGALTGDWSALDALLAEPARLARRSGASLDEDGKRG